MGRRLTKEMLISYGVTNVTEDGKVYVNGHEVKQRLTGRSHKYGEDIYYLTVSLTDKSKPKIEYTLHKTNKKVSCSYRFGIQVSRIMLAWFNGSIEGNLDADHIDGDRMNNHLSNLQAITRRENLLKRAKTQKDITIAYYRLKRAQENKNESCDNLES